MPYARSLHPNALVTSFSLALGREGSHLEHVPEDSHDLEQWLGAGNSELIDERPLRDGFRILTLGKAHLIETRLPRLDLHGRRKVAAGRRDRGDHHDTGRPPTESIRRHDQCGTNPPLLPTDRLSEVDQQISLGVGSLGSVSP